LLVCDSNLVSFVLMHMLGMYGYVDLLQLISQGRLPYSSRRVVHRYAVMPCRVDVIICRSLFTGVLLCVLMLLLYVYTSYIVMICLR
jgi:hypothetical protein